MSRISNSSMAIQAAWFRLASLVLHAALHCSAVSVAHGAPSQEHIHAQILFSSQVCYLQGDAAHHVSRTDCDALTASISCVMDHQGKVNTDSNGMSEVSLCSAVRCAVCDSVMHNKLRIVKC